MGNKNSRKSEKNVKEATGASAKKEAATAEEKSDNDGKPVLAITYAEYLDILSKELSNIFPSVLVSLVLEFVPRAKVIDERSQVGTIHWVNFAIWSPQSPLICSRAATIFVEASPICKCGSILEEIAKDKNGQPMSGRPIRACDECKTLSSFYECTGRDISNHVDNYGTCKDCYENVLNRKAKNLKQYRVTQSDAAGRLWSKTKPKTNQYQRQQCVFSRRVQLSFTDEHVRIRLYISGWHHNSPCGGYPCIGVFDLNNDDFINECNFSADDAAPAFYLVHGRSEIPLTTERRRVVSEYIKSLSNPKVCPTVFECSVASDAGVEMTILDAVGHYLSTKDVAQVANATAHRC